MMNTIPDLLVSNVVLAALLGVLAVVLTRLWRNPQFAHALWLLVLVKLVTPPLIHVPMPQFSPGSGEQIVDAESDDSHETVAAGESMVQGPAAVEAISGPPEFEDAARVPTQAGQSDTSALTFWQSFLPH
ncbi:MAG: hypothetical protein ABGZ53_14955 [Fuerstiella sp.]